VLRGERVNVAELRLSANFLGDAEPGVTLKGPSLEFRQRKESFEKDRIRKWWINY
jgi:hypothetical protein